MSEKHSNLTLVFLDSQGNFIDRSPFEIVIDGTPLEYYGEGDCDRCKYVGFRLNYNGKTIEVFE